MAPQPRRPSGLRRRRPRWQTFFHARTTVRRYWAFPADDPYRQGWVDAAACVLSEPVGGAREGTQLILDGALGADGRVGGW